MQITEWLKVTTHMAPMAMQAGLLNLVWTCPEYRHSPIIRWIRLSLLPISLSFLLSDLWNLKYNSQLSNYTKTNMGCTWGGHAFRVILLAFQQPPSGPQPQVSSSNGKSASKDPSRDDQPAIPFVFKSLLLAFTGSTNPSKQPQILRGGSQDIHADMIFLLITLRRLVLLHFMGVAALMCWKMSNEATIAVDQPILNLIRNFKSEIRAFCFGIFVWMGIDLSGCIPRVSMLTLKLTSRLLSRFIPDPAIPAKVRVLNQLDLSRNCPLFFKNLPIGASSVTDFWSRHWHEILKDLFIEAGATPVTCLLVNFLGCQPKSTTVRIAGIMGAFTISAVLHEVGLWVADPFGLSFKTSIFFLSQGAGVCLENGYKKASGRNVNGFLGRVWLLTWLVYFGTPMVSLWVDNLGLDENRLFRRVEETSLFRLIFWPLIVPQLLLA